MIIKLAGTGSMQSLDNPACYIIDKKILIDMPNGMLLTLKRANLLFDIEYVFITHLHGDHVFDIPFLLLEKYSRKKKVIIFVNGVMKRKIIKLTNMAFPNKSREIINSKYIKFVDNKHNQIDDKIIDRFPVIHGIMKNTFGYQVKSKETVVTFTGDCKLCEGVKKSASISNYMICDATYIEGNSKHMGINDIWWCLNRYPNLKIVPTHMGIKSKKELLKIKNKNLIVKNDMEELII